MKKNSTSITRIMQSLVACITTCMLSALPAHADTAKNPTTKNFPSSGLTLEKCFGITKAGSNDCALNGVSSCSGTSTKDKDPNAFLILPQGTCSKIVGGSLTPAQKK